MWLWCSFLKSEKRTLEKLEVSGLKKWAFKMVWKNTLSRSIMKSAQYKVLSQTKDEKNSEVSKHFYLCLGSANFIKVQC